METTNEKIGREEFEKLVKFSLSPSDFRKVMLAYRLSKYGHRNQMRETGERYFEHPKAVALIIIQELKLQDRADLIVTALLHDLQEDTFLLEWNNKWIRYDKNLIDKTKKEYANLVDKKYFENPKIFLREIALNIECCYDNEGYYSLNKAYLVQSVSEYSLMYLLALLNSKLLSFYFRGRFGDAHVRGGYLQLKKIYTSQIPIRSVDFRNKKEKQKHDDISILGEKMMDLNRQLLNLEANSDRWNRMKSEIEKTDKKIDEEVYKLYDLSPEEISIIEAETSKK